MAKKVDIWWPLAEVTEADGSVTLMKTEEGMKPYFAFKEINKWREEFAGRIHNVRIDVRGEKRRLKYTMHFPDKRTKV